MGSLLGPIGNDWTYLIYLRPLGSATRRSARDGPSRDSIRQHLEKIERDRRGALVARKFQIWCTASDCRFGSTDPHGLDRVTVL